jgi:hypothetical protein
VGFFKEPARRRSTGGCPRYHADCIGRTDAGAVPPVRNPNGDVDALEEDPTKTLSKSDFIRAQPATMSAAEVIAKGKAQGIKIGSSLVYVVRRRSSGKKRGASRTQPRSRRPRGTALGLRSRHQARDPPPKTFCAPLRPSWGWVGRSRSSPGSGRGCGRQQGGGRRDAQPSLFPPVVTRSSLAHEQRLSAIRLRHRTSCQLRSRRSPAPEPLARLARLQQSGKISIAFAEAGS